MGGRNWPLLMEMLHHSQGAQSDLYLWKMLHHSRGPQLIFINGKTLRHSWGAPTDLYWWKNLTSLTRGPDWPLLMEKRYVNHRGPLRSLDLYQLIYINLNICGEEFSGFPSLFCVLFKINTHQTFKDTRPKPAYGRQGLDWNYNGPPLIQKHHVTHGGPNRPFRCLDTWRSWLMLTTLWKVSRSPSSELPCLLAAVCCTNWGRWDPKQNVDSAFLILHALLQSNFHSFWHFLNL